MYSDGVLEVHGNVVFEANTAGDDGGAVSLPFVTMLLLPIAVFCDRVCEGWFDFVQAVDLAPSEGLVVELQSRDHSFSSQSPPHSGSHVLGRSAGRARQCVVRGEHCRR